MASSVYPGTVVGADGQLRMPTSTGTTGQALRLSSTTGLLEWTTDGGGDLVGPASATDNSIVRYDGTTGKLVQNSGVQVLDSNIIKGVDEYFLQSGGGGLWEKRWLRLPSDSLLGFAQSTNASDVVDVVLVRDAAGVLYQRNGTNAQTHLLSASYTDASNYSRASLAATTTDITLSADVAGTHASDNVNIVLTPAGTGEVTISGGMSVAGTWLIDSSARFAGVAFNPDGDNTRTLGGSGYSWAQIWGHSLIIADSTVIDGSRNVTANTVQVADGTRLAPSISFSDETSVGLARLGTSQLGISTGASGNCYFAFQATNFRLGRDTTFGFTSGLDALDNSADTYLVRDSANTLAMRNGVNAQTHRWYGSYTDASNYSRASLAATTTDITLSADVAGTHASDNVNINLTPTGTGTTVIGNGRATLEQLVFTPNSGVDSAWGSANGGNGLVYFAGGTEFLALSPSGMNLRFDAGLHWVVSTSTTSTTDISLYRESAGTLYQRNGTNAQTHLLSASYTDASNYSRASLAATTTDITLSADVAGTHASDNVNIVLSPAGTGDIKTAAKIRDVTYSGNHLDVNYAAGQVALSGNSALLLKVGAATIATCVPASCTFGIPITGTSDVLEQRNSTNAQTYLLSASYTDASNYSRASLAATTTDITLSADVAGTHASDNVNIVLSPAGTGAVLVPGTNGYNDSTPPYSFSGDTNTGFSNPVSDAIEVICAGTAKGRFQTNGLQLPLGSVTGPALGFMADSHTGMYWVENDSIGFSAGGVNQLTLNTTDATFSGIVKTNDIEMDKTTADEAFINFKATADADATSAISTLTTSGAVTHHIQIEINGVTAWIPCSTTDPT